ncbi:UNVERIFIED_CONTAM: hypothetical protein ABID98_002402 [Brevibacillus sp. OAP136]
MEQTTVRRYIERYFQAFATHVMESHPDYLSVTLPVEVDKDIGNRPFYWTWVEKMNLPYQPLTLTFFFNDQVPQGLRGEPLHFGSARLAQIFQSAHNHGRFVCMYEQTPFLQSMASPLRGKRSVPLVPWLGLNVKISFICDKKKDVLCYFGVNLHQPRLVQDFYPFLKRLTLSPSIPDYHFTLDRRLSLDDAVILMKQETERIVATHDASWAEKARERLQEEIEILEAYYDSLSENEREDESEDDEDTSADEAQLVSEEEQLPMTSDERANDIFTNQDRSPCPQDPAVPTGPVRILDFLRMNGIQETPKEAIVQEDWQASSPTEEKERRIAELKWQYEPRIELTFINGGIFYLQNQPPFHH